MSKNHPHDNMYSILGKLAALQPTPEEKRFALVKEIRESVEAKGSVLQGVDAVQARLAEQFTETKTNEAIRVMGNTKGPVGHYSQAKYYHRGTPDAQSPEGQAHRDATAAMAKSARAAGGKLSIGRTNEPTGKRVHGGYDAMAKGVTPFRTSAEECAMCESGNCEEHGMVEGETTYKNGVTTHRKTDFPGYPTDDGDDIEDANKGKRGRPRKHAVKVAKTDAGGNKLGRGRPKKDAAPVYSKMNDPFGRVPNKAPKTKLKGRTHTMAEAMDKLSQRFSRISEGINFAELLKSKHQTVDEMLSELQQDIKQFKDTGHCSELLKDCMEIKGYHGKVVADEATNPSNPFYKKQNDYNLPPAMRGHGTADYTLPDVKAHDNIERDHYRDRAGLPPLDTSLEEELSELAKLAGLSEVSRGDYIKQKDTEAEHSGKNKFQAFGQEFDTDEITEEPNEGNTFTKGLEDDDVEIGDKIPGTNAVKKVDIDESVEDTINVATNMSSNGDKNVTVTANGSQAAELLQMLRIAGLGNGQAAQDLQGQADTPIDAQVDGEEGIEVIELPAQEPEVDEAETHVDDAGANPVNAPNEKYMSMKGSTMGPGEGDSGEKAMNPDRPTKNNGDNALATPPTRAQKTLIAVSALESKLAAEYESIKKLSA